MNFPRVIESVLQSIAEVISLDAAGPPEKDHLKLLDKVLKQLDKAGQSWSTLQNEEVLIHKTSGRLSWTQD